MVRQPTSPWLVRKTENDCKDLSCHSAFPTLPALQAGVAIPVDVYSTLKISIGREPARPPLPRLFMRSGFMVVGNGSGNRLHRTARARVLQSSEASAQLAGLQVPQDVSSSSLDTCLAICGALAARPPTIKTPILANILSMLAWSKYFVIKSAGFSVPNTFSR